MKLRAAVSVLAIVAALTACSSSAKNGSPSVANNTAPAGASTGAPPVSGGGSASAFCAKLQADTSKLGSLAGASGSSDLSALKAELGQDVSAFQDLANGAPAQIKPAIDDIVTGLQSAQQAVADPSHPDPSKLTALATTLPTDANKLATYAAANCH